MWFPRKMMKLFFQPRDLSKVSFIADLILLETGTHCIFQNIIVFSFTVSCVWIRFLTPVLYTRDNRYNSLSKLTEGDFAGLKKLELLMLHSNEIQTIHENAFQDLSSLQVWAVMYRIKHMNKKYIWRESLQGWTSTEEMLWHRKNGQIQNTSYRMNFHWLPPDSLHHILTLLINIHT